MGNVKNGQRWVFKDDAKVSNPSEGVTREVLAYCDDALCAVHHFEEGAVGALHKHPHTQITYVAEGAFEFDIDGETKTVRKGDTMLKTDGVIHGCKCIEKGVLVDFFTPMRDDFI